MTPEYVEAHTIFECIVGSQAYGTHNEFSDTDYAGVMIPGYEYFLGQKRVEQFQGYTDLDKTIFEIRKALTLVADNNPNMLDLLFTPERCIVQMHSVWEKIIENRSIFLSKRMRYTFSGYAIAQLDRIKTHRKFLLNPLKAEPKRSDFGLPEESMFPTSQIKAVCQAALEIIIESEREPFVAELDRIYGDYVVPLLTRFIIPEERTFAMEWLQAGLKAQCHAFTSLGSQYIKDEYVEQAQRELKFHNAMSEWKQYLNWQKTRNPKRADLEAKFGYDTKHSMHLVRLLRMGREGLLEGTLHVDRTNIDVEELKFIRNGGWPFEKVEEYAKEQDVVLADIYKISKLPKSPDRELIHELCIDVVKTFLG
ncbi:MAG: nucleotidyltransferase domain-containing protein [Candidatus Nanoarchaeia archaeon]|nr:nucleotidyltransferase domain-containing protein [Candidatus Nanoarchaeia archaeon]